MKNKQGPSPTGSPAANNNPEKRKRRMFYERDKYTEYQNTLYKRALFGLSVYPPEELKAMTIGQKRELENKHRHVQKVMNLWKQRITNKICNALLKKYFPESPLALSMRKKYTITDPKFKNTISFRDLRIDKDQIVEKLIEEGVLPKDFHELRKKPKTLKQHASGIVSKRDSLPVAQS